MSDIDIGGGGDAGRRLPLTKPYHNAVRIGRKSQTTRHQDRNNNATPGSGNGDGDHVIVDHRRRRGRSRTSTHDNENIKTLIGSENDSEVNLGLEEENLLLRHHMRKQEAQIKSLAAKLLRIIEEKKNKEKRDQLQIEQQKNKIFELEQNIASLKEKLQVKSIQLTSYTKFIPTSANRRPSPSAKSVKLGHEAKHLYGIAGLRRPSSTRSGQMLLDSEFTAKAEQCLIKAENENRALQEDLQSTREKLLLTRKELERNSRSWKEMDRTQQDEIRRLKSRLDAYERQDKENGMHENVEIVRLEREERKKTNFMATMQAQCGVLESSLSTANATVGQLESQISVLQDEVRDGQQKMLALIALKEDSGSQLSRLKEFEAVLKGLQDENQILKKTNESLVAKTLQSAAVPSSSSSRAKLKEKDEEAEALKEELAQLESKLKSELTSKAELTEHLNSEMAKSTLLEQSVTESKERIDQLTLQLEELREQLNKYKYDESQSLTEKEEFQAILSKVTTELESTKNLLASQKDINNQCQLEITTLQSRWTDHQKALDEKSTLLDTVDKTLTTLHVTPTPPLQDEQASSSVPLHQEGQGVPASAIPNEENRGVASASLETEATVPSNVEAIVQPSAPPQPKDEITDEIDDFW